MEPYALLNSKPLLDKVPQPLKARPRILVEEEGFPAKPNQVQHRGPRAQQLFQQSGISVVLGSPPEAPEQVAAAYLAGTLQSGDNACDH